MKLKPLTIILFICAFWLSSYRNLALADSCSISGQIYGIDRYEGQSFYVVVFEPNSRKALGKFTAANNYFVSLDRSGRYVVRVFREQFGSFNPVKTNPERRTIDCSNGGIANADFALP
jgi:hypothetical protein